MQQNLYRGIYLCLGYPSQEKSLAVLAILRDHPGVDFIELGLPFSDPVADGPVISAAAQSALANAKAQGLSPRQMLDQALDVLRGNDKKVYLMTYGNIVSHLLRQYGDKTFNRLPINGLIIPDVPLREQNFFRQRGLEHSVIPFATPETTDQDLKLLAQEPVKSAPFVYFVAIRGITGSKMDFRNPELRKQYAKVSQAVKENHQPVVLGFGIQGRTQIQQLAEFANGFVIGTAAVELQGEPAGYRNFLDSL
ncbi:tryptophan synthase subunit alpha [Candidatus Haliotispira prima]|uniref:tryptophan synthase n=1 Tax=Candidatus Haliotispira prima TaxID=3034016 RepID=A0ABY8MIY8_9SPIO|nr:tryptophan synthase subunit alpha [Candidatus Haliotispira prima]